jgi:hypothetical protein
VSLVNKQVCKSQLISRRNVRCALESPISDIRRDNHKSSPHIEGYPLLPAITDKIATMLSLANWLTSESFRWCVGTVIGLAGVWLAYLQVRANRQSIETTDALRGERVRFSTRRHPHTPTAGVYGIFERTGYFIFALLAGRYAASLEVRRNGRVRTGAFAWCAAVAAPQKSEGSDAQAAPLPALTVPPHDRNTDLKDDSSRGEVGQV